MRYSEEMKSHYDRKECLYIFEEVMGKQSSKEWQRIQYMSDKAQKYKDTRDDKNVTQGFKMKDRSDFVKKDNLFIHE